MRFQNRWAITATPSTNLVSSRLANQSQTKLPTTVKDLANVGTILTKLLQNNTLFPEPNSFHKKIGALFTRGRTEALRDLFRATIVKTRTKDLVLDLPKLISRTVFVEPLPLERMVYNALVALFVTNSITSQKEDVRTHSIVDLIIRTRSDPLYVDRKTTSFMPNRNLVSKNYSTTSPSLRFSSDPSRSKDRCSKRSSPSAISCATKEPSGAMRIGKTSRSPCCRFNSW